MNDNKHTPEPWTAKQSRLYGNETILADKDGHYIASIRANSDLSDGDSQDIASRIVACVNACAGCATEVLETAPVGFFNSTYGHPKYLEEITKQRDELLAALENCRLLAARHRKEEWAGHVLRFCGESGVAGEVMR